MKQFVGVHTKVMKAADKILDEEGVTLAKCSVLCGLPDWPASALTGVMKKPMLSMVLCTTPCFWNVICVTASAAGMSRSAEGAL